MKELFQKIFKKSLGKAEKREKTPPMTERRVLEEKAIEGAKKAIREYRRVFERLSEHDRT